VTKAERIRILREGKGISQVELAERIGVSKQNMYKYENNVITNIPSDKIEAMAKVLNVSPGYIMGWEDNEDKISDISTINSDELISFEKIKDYKKAKGYTNKMLSDLTGISISSLDKITSGENTNPKLGTIRLICKALGCNMDDLLSEENNDAIASSEFEMINKYRKLDPHGAKIVDLVLNEEYERCVAEQVTYKNNTVTVATAARNGGEPVIETITKEQHEALKKAKPRTY